MSITQVSLKQEYNNLLTSEEPVIDGYGEYLVYGGGEALTEETFANVYKIFNFYRRNVDVGMNVSLTELISSEVKAINNHLEVVFIPSILHDLLYIVAAIKEDNKEELGACGMQDMNIYEGAKCPQRDFVFQNLYHISGGIEYLKHKYNKCWHLICSTDNNPVVNDDSNLIHLAYRFNRYCLKKLKPQGPFKGSDIAVFTEKQIKFLTDHYNVYNDIFKNKTANLSSNQRLIPGLAINFGLSQKDVQDTLDAFYMMGVNKKYARLIRRVVALECSENAKNSIIFYRAGNLIHDRRLNSESIKQKSLSYGTSLFAGCVRDGTACVFHWIVGRERKAYAVVVPFNEYRNSPFYAPGISALTGLLAVGEFFHGRSRILTEGLAVDKRIDGVATRISESQLEDLKTEMTAEELAHALNKYHRQAYRITRSKSTV